MLHCKLRKHVDRRTLLKAKLTRIKGIKIQQNCKPRKQTKNQSLTDDTVRLDCSGCSLYVQ